MEEKKETKEKTTKTTKKTNSTSSNGTKKSTKTNTNNKGNNKKKSNNTNNSNKQNKTVTNKKNSSVNKKEEEIEQLEKTNSFDIVIDDERLKDKESLDFSFIDGKRKKEKARDDIEILEDIDYKEEAKKVDIPKKEHHGGDFFSTMLIILFSFVLGFLMCFIWARESEYFVETEEVVEEVTKVVVDDNYVFLGDSIFQRYNLEKFYEDMPVINSGISGNKTTDILNNMEERVYKYNPSKVILMIGTNDYSSISNEDTVKNIGKIIDGIKENRKYAEIYVQSIYPVNKNVNNGVSVDGRNNEDIRTMNEGIKKLCEEKEVTYMNIHDLLTDEDGNLKEEYTGDGLHLNDSAYTVVTAEVMKVLKK